MVRPEAILTTLRKFAHVCVVFKQKFAPVSDSLSIITTGTCATRALARLIQSLIQGLIQGPHQTRVQEIGGQDATGHPLRQFALTAVTFLFISICYRIIERTILWAQPR